MAVTSRKDPDRVDNFIGRDSAIEIYRKFSIKLQVQSLSKSGTKRFSLFEIARVTNGLKPLKFLTKGRSQEHTIDSNNIRIHTGTRN